MLIRPSDAARDEAEWRGFVERVGFGQLVVAADPWPILAPTHFVLQGDRALMHYARDNPVLAAVRARGEAVLTVLGDYAYIPGRWNAGEEGPPHLGVPTSYYAAVHLRGVARVVDEAEENARILNALLDRFEPAVGGVDRLAPGDPRLPQLAAIRSIVLDVRDVQAKFKYGGNRPEPHRRNVADRLAERDGPLDAAVRDQVLRRL